MPSPPARSRSPRRSRTPPSKRRDRSPDGPRDTARKRDRSPDRHGSSRRDHDNELDARNRNRSPPREPKDKKPNYSKAFKWKSKAPESREEDRSRDFRDRDRDRDYLSKRHGGRDDRERRVDRERERDREYDRDNRRDGHRDDRRGNNRHRDNDRKPDTRNADRPPPRPAAPAPSGAGVTFILVTVNDRLGTKATIPCLGSDTVGDFKKLVAAQIGRKPHEIMLKRQGQRPLKDNITLEDYEINNGVQLDLELDTGD